MKEQCRRNVCNEQTIIVGNSMDVQINDCDSEIKADITVSEVRSIRLWGQVKNYEGKPIAGAMVKLIKVFSCECNYEYQGVAHTLSDGRGFYQFDISPEEAGSCFKIIVSKVATGRERVLSQSCSDSRKQTQTTSPCFSNNDEFYEFTPECRRHSEPCEYVCKESTYTCMPRTGCNK